MFKTLTQKEFSKWYRAAETDVVKLNKYSVSFEVLGFNWDNEQMCEIPFYDMESVENNARVIREELTALGYTNIYIFWAFGELETYVDRSEFKAMSPSGTQYWAYGNLYEVK